MLSHTRLCLCDYACAALKNTANELKAQSTTAVSSQQAPWSYARRFITHPHVHQCTLSHGPSLMKNFGNLESPWFTPARVTWLLLPYLRFAWFVDKTQISSLSGPRSLTTFLATTTPKVGNRRKRDVRLPSSHGSHAPILGQQDVAPKARFRSRSLPAVTHEP
jgi:hypothetical protein